MTSIGVRRSAEPGRGRRYLSAFWHRAYEENITGLAAMVAYNLVLALFPFALLVLFIFGRILQSPDAQSSVLSDLQRLFPAVEINTLNSALTRIRDSSTTIGVAAAVGAVWIGTSFWGAMDTAFCRIYHVRCRGWLEQKRFALLMLLVVILFLAASVVVPTLEGALVSGAQNLPFGLSKIHGIASVLLLIGALVGTFLLCCMIYYFVPKGHVPWHGVWLGAVFVTVTVGIANAVYPFYLAEVSSVGEIGGTIGFILIALVWFYIVSLALMAGGVINALRYETRDTGTLPLPENAG
ncbi:MAG TPA: YihY/virulence factor BrkB family protein [Solirubrobacterales bacterium]|nr:YihY/virulence factor BrkB family protein [Solirubrobacterales bacterium]